MQKQHVELERQAREFIENCYRPLESTANAGRWLQKSFGEANRNQNIK